MNDAYTAGIIDGEGTITIANQDGYYYVRVNVTMSDKGYRVLDFLHREYGGMMGKERPANGNTRASKQWRVSNGDATRVIIAVLNHLRLKREQALVALQLWDLIEEAPKKPNGRTEWSDSMKASAEVLKRRMGELNARGVCGPEPQIAHEGAVAVWKYGEWHEPEDDLFGPVPFGGKLPVSGSMRNGMAYALPTLGHHMDASASLFSELGVMLPTPTVSKRPNRSASAGAKERPSIHQIDQLLPTPEAKLATSGPDYARMKRGGSGGHDLTTALHLLPTPKAGDADFGTPRTSGRPPEKSTHLMTRLVYTLPIGPDMCAACGHDDLVHDADGFCANCSPNDCRDLPGGQELLPTPTTTQRGPDANLDTRDGARANLHNEILERSGSEWGPYEAAIRRWERVLGRPAPEPTEVGPKGGRRLSSRFVEWMMGLPEGWVTARGLPRTAELRMLGNGVLTQQAIAALRLMRAAR